MKTLWYSLKAVLPVSVMLMNIMNVTFSKYYLNHVRILKWRECIKLARVRCCIIIKCRKTSLKTVCACFFHLPVKNIGSEWLVVKKRGEDLQRSGPYATIICKTDNVTEKMENYKGNYENFQCSTLTFRGKVIPTGFSSLLVQGPWKSMNNK